MTQDDQILNELQQINKHLANKSTFKVMFDNLLAGIFHSLGYFLGTILIFWILFLFARQLDIPQLLSKQFEMIMSQVQWNKVLPTPTPRF